MTTAPSGGGGPGDDGRLWPVLLPRLGGLEDAARSVRILGGGCSSDSAENSPELVGVCLAEEFEVGGPLWSGSVVLDVKGSLELPSGIRYRDLGLADLDLEVP